MHSNAQLNMFGPTWIDGLAHEPPDGASIVYYYLFEKPEELTEWDLKHTKDYCGKKLGGPLVGKYNKKYHDDGDLRPVAYWQPLELLA